MFMGLGMPIPDLSNKPGPGRPGWATGAYEFQFEVDGQVTIKAHAASGGGSFTIKWPNGSSQSYSGNNGTIVAPDATAGIVAINNKLDTGYCDEFAVTGGKDKVKKVISWGERPWKKLSFAFSTCPNLTNIENTKLIGAANCNIEYLFFNCTGLTEALCENWDLSLGCEMRYLFESCTNLELLNLTGSKLPGSGTAASNYSFHEVGSTTTNGCEFKMSGLNFTGTVNAPGRQWFKLAKFKDGSNLSNWTFDSALNSFYATDLFASATVNGTLDISNWNWPNQQFPSFNSVNSGLTSQNGSKIKLTNFDVSKVNNFASAFVSCKVYELEGLSTWGACAGNASIYRMFSGATLMRINSNDNFSNTFVASLTPTYVHEAFNNFGLNLQDSELGVCPNLNGLNLSNLLSSNTLGLSQFMRNHKSTNTPDFSNVTFSSTNTVGFANAFREFKTTGTGNDSVFNFNPINVKPANFQSTWYFAGGLTEINIGNNVDMSSMTSITQMFYAVNYNATASPFTNATFATNADFSSLTDFGTWAAFAGQVLSPCQVDNFFRRLRATNNNSNVTANFYSCKVTEAPSVARSYVDYFENTKSWNITLATPDATLPFAYASYAVDPTGITTISPTVTPPAGSVFTATNGLSISASGVITIGSFRGGSTIRCTYPDGCYNEVKIVIQVPFVMRTVIPASGSTSAYVLKPQMSAGECFVNWGDTAETLTGNTTHNYPASGSDTTYDIEIFDSPGGSKFEGFNAAWDTSTITSYENSIMQWGEIQWKNNKWFLTGLPNSALPKLRLSAPNGPSHKPDLSQVTSLYQLFYNKTKSRNLIWEDVNNNLADWDTSTITNMAQAFHLSGSPSSRPSDSQPNTMQLSNWDVSNVTDMSSIFYGHANNGNGYFASNIGVDLSNWNTQNVENFSSAFRCKGALTGIENLRTESCTNMSYMFDSRAFPGNVNTKYVNGALRWDVSKVSNFTSFNYKGSSSQGFFPDKWKLSGDGQDVNMANAFWTFMFQATDSQDLCATKTVNETWYGGTSYTAWDMSNTTNISNMFRGARPSSYNPNISTWQISNKLTTMQYFTRADGSQISGLLGLDQDLGHWDVTNISSPNGLLQFVGFRNANERPNFSIANYDSILSIADGWGSQAANVNSGVVMDFGHSQYTPGTVINVVWGANTGSSVGSNKLYTANFNLQAGTSVGDIVYYPNSLGRTEYARITGYVDANTATTTTTNWGVTGSNQNFQIFDSNAAKGRFALIEAGWTITDGGAYIPFDSTEIEITVQAGDTFRMSLRSGTTNTNIDWDDGNGFTSLTTYYADKTYTNAGTYTIKLNETSADSFPGFNFGSAIVSSTQRNMITKIKKWGTNPYIGSWDRAFYNCTNLVSIDDTASPNLTSTTDLEEAFRGCQGLTTFDFSNWVLPATLTDLNNMFNDCFVASNASFNTLINWDVSNVEIFSGMFADCRLMNANISNWDTSSATNMSYMFDGAYVFDQNIGNWKTNNVTDMTAMFRGTRAFNQDIDTKVIGSGASAYIAWDTYNVTTFSAMFWGASAFNQDIGNWNTTGCTGSYGMSGMFGSINFVPYDPPNNNFNSLRQQFNNGGQSLLTKDVTVGSGTPVSKTYVAWDTANVKSFGNNKYANFAYGISAGMFQNNQVFNQDISNWDISGVTATNGVSPNPGHLKYMFMGAATFDQDLTTKTITNVTGKGSYTAWNFSNIVGAEFMFGPYVYGPGSNFNRNLSSWQLNSGMTSGDFRNMFAKNVSFSGQQFGVNGMSTANYTDTFVAWANQAYNNSGAPTNLNFSGQTRMTFDSNRSGGANFANAFAAREYLTNTTANGGLGWTISGDTITTLLVSSTNSLSFNGSSEYVDTFYAPDSSLANAFSISAYVKASSIDTSGNAGNTIIGTYDFTNTSGSGGQNRARFYVNIQNNSGAYEFLVGFGSYQAALEISNFTLSQWNHIAVTYDGSNLKLYCNGGSPQHTISLSSIGLLPPLGSYDAHLYIGATNRFSGTQSVDQHWHGDIDEVMLWNTAITQANVQTLDDAIGSGNVPDPATLASGVQLWNRMGD